MTTEIECTIETPRGILRVDVRVQETNGSLVAKADDSGEDQYGDTYDISPVDQFRAEYRALEICRAMENQND